MSVALRPTESNPFILHFGPVLRKLSDEDFFQFCQANRDWRIERTSNGDIIIMAPAGGETGKRNFDLTAAFSIWQNRWDGSGIRFIDGLHATERRCALTRFCLGKALALGRAER